MSEELPQLRIKPPSLLDRVKESPVTIVLTVLNFGWFVFAETHGRTETTKILIEFGAVERIHVWSGEYWRVASYMFLHIGWMHIAWNTWASFDACTTLEGFLGSFRYLLLYLLAGIGGGCAAAYFSSGVTAGASGAMFGVIGALLAVREYQIGNWSGFFADKGVRSTFFRLAIWTGGFLAAELYSKGEYGKISHSGHGGGFVVGALVAYALVRRRPVLYPVVGAVLLALILAAARPGWRPTGDDEKRAPAFAGAYLDQDKLLPDNPARGERIARKACAAGVTEACDLKPGPGKQF